MIAKEDLKCTIQTELYVMIKIHKLGFKMEYFILLLIMLFHSKYSFISKLILPQSILNKAIQTMLVLKAFGLY